MPRKGLRGPIKDFSNLSKCHFLDFVMDGLQMHDIINPYNKQRCLFALIDAWTFWLGENPGRGDESRAELHVRAVHINGFLEPTYQILVFYFHTQREGAHVDFVFQVRDEKS
jgi:hypothetical protein